MEVAFFKRMRKSRVRVELLTDRMNDAQSRMLTNLDFAVRTCPLPDAGPNPDDGRRWSRPAHGATDGERRGLGVRQAFLWVVNHPIGLGLGELNLLSPLPVVKSIRGHGVRTCVLD